MHRIASLDGCFCAGALHGSLAWLLPVGGVYAASVFGQVTNRAKAAIDNGSGAEAHASTCPSLHDAPHREPEEPELEIAQPRRQCKEGRRVEPVPRPKLHQGTPRGEERG